MTQDHLSQLRGPKGPKHNVLVTGAAGFIGMHTAIELKQMGMTPVGYDNVNSYYSTRLKESRLEELKNHGIAFERGDVCDAEKLKEVIKSHKITRFVHLAAQAGVRYSLDHPFEYTRNNIDCTVNILEVMKELGMTEYPLVYASSSSVYGNNIKVPFQETDPVEDPASLYAATKRSDELIARTYFNLHNISSIGLRFFTVYGPYGRPDMAPWMFTDKISNNETIQVFNHGMSRRDFTYIDDIVQGVVNSLLVDRSRVEAEVINLGNGRPVLLADFVRIVEERVGRPAQIESLGMQKGDVPKTYADISKAQYLLGYMPSTPIEEGIDKFVEWFQQHDASQYRMTQEPSSTKTSATKPQLATQSSNSRTS
jgi:UDP-glucuronate 4-epimerase